MAEVDDNGGSLSMPYPSTEETSSSQVKPPLKHSQGSGQRTRSDSENDQQQRIESEDAISDQNGHRSSRGHYQLSLEGDEDGDTSMADDDDDNSARGLRVEDIAMSPIPFDHEDPATLMELPENILTMPISPCGPHDDPASSI
jgi:hypothetical protein